jgi:hypothetical protein
MSKFYRFIVILYSEILQFRNQNHRNLSEFNIFTEFKFSFFCQGHSLPDAFFWIQFHLKHLFNCFEV